MTKVLITEGTLSDIGDAIRAKNGGALTYLPGEMPAAIRAIETGGGMDVSVTGTKLVFGSGASVSGTTVQIGGGET